MEMHICNAHVGDLVLCVATKNRVLFTGPVCRKNSMSSRFCAKLKLLGRCGLRSVQKQCCVTCTSWSVMWGTGRRLFRCSVVDTEALNMASSPGLESVDTPGAGSAQRRLSVLRHTCLHSPWNISAFFCTWMVVCVCVWCYCFLVQCVLLLTVLNALFSSVTTKHSRSAQSRCNCVVYFFSQPCTLIVPTCLFFFFFCILCTTCTRRWGTKWGK